MLAIRANDNATVDVLEGSFPLGDRNTMRIIIADNIIKNYINEIGTNTCIPAKNLYSYGDFSCEDDIGHISYSVKIGDEVMIAKGFGTNINPCLYCKGEDLDINMKPDINQVDTYNNIKYKFSCTVCATENTDAHLVLKGVGILDVPADGEWHELVKEFTPTEDFNLNINTLGVGTIYIDNVMLFKSADEIYENIADDLEFEVEIKNPIQDTVISDVINFSKADETEPYVTLYVPPITVVDYASNIMCKLRISVLSDPTTKYLGDTHYNKVKQCIYYSDPFILTGYVVPIESDRYELVAGSI